MDAFAAYRRDARHATLELSRARQLALHKRAKRGDAEAERQLIRSLLPFAIEKAFQFRDRGLPLDELIQLANLGIIAAVKEWEPSKGALTTRAADCCFRVIMDSIYQHMRVIKTNKHAFKTGRIPKYESVDSPAALNLTDKLPGPDKQAQKNEERERLQRVLRCVHPEYRKVLDLRLQGMTLKEAGQALGITKERARQIEEIGLAKAIAARERIYGAKDGTKGQAAEVRAS